MIWRRVRTPARWTPRLGIWLHRGDVSSAPADDPGPRWSLHCEELELGPVGGGPARVRALRVIDGPDGLKRPGEEWTMDRNTANGLAAAGALELLAAVPAPESRPASRQDPPDPDPEAVSAPESPAPSRQIPEAESVCPECGRGFRSSRGMAAHRRRMHGWTGSIVEK